MNTPRTDAEIDGNTVELVQTKYGRMIQFSRTLERELTAANARIEELESKIQHLLNHCKDAECSTCAEIVCKHHEPLHFHHDGCPVCDVGYTAQQIGESWLANSSLERWFPITAEELAKLRVMVSELEKDRARLDWLERLNVGKAVGVYNEQGCHFRTAIDTAMKGQS